ncbi:MAG: hypothetical protein DWG75_02180 [Chloroflexi bacterium]|nr:hypothetical protein [Chloroflexota bacterium]
MLSNRFYVGEISYKNEFTVKGKHEAIIDHALWQSVAESRHRRSAQRGTGSRGNHPYLLRGTGICSLCQAGLWGNRSRNHHYYRCANQRRGTGCPNRSHGVRAEALDEKVSALFADVRIPDGWRAVVLRLLDEETADRGALENERGRIERRIARVREALFEGIVDITTARSEVATAQSRLREVERAITSEPKSPQLVDDFVNLRSLWPHMTATERQGVVQAALEEVEVDLEAQRVVAFKPRPAMEPLFAALEVTEANADSVCAWRPRSDSNRRSPP